MTQDEKDRLEMEELKIKIELFKQFWTRILKQGVLVTALFVAVGALCYAVIWQNEHSASEIKLLRAEYKADLKEAQTAVRECEQERLRQAAVFDEKIQGLRDIIERSLLKKR